MKVTSWLALIYVGLLSSEALAELTCPDDAAAEPNRPMAVSGKPDGVEEVPVLYESQALTASAPSPFDDFGLEGSIDGDTLAVGKAPPGAAAQADPLRLKDGTLYAALHGDRVNMHCATSRDQGLTWSPVKDLGFPGHCPHFTRLSTGDILLVHRLPKTALHLSRDDAQTWKGPYTIDETIGAYPSTLQLKDGSVLVVYYEEGQTSAIRVRRFRLTADGIEFLAIGQ